MHIRIRLLISSVDKAREMGINWWEGDPYLTSKAQNLMEENRLLQDRLQSLEAEMRSLKASAISQLPFSGTEKLENPQAAARKRRSTKKKANPPHELESK